MYTTMAHLFIMHKPFCHLQMLMNAPVEHSLVILMPTALTLLAVSCAIASLDTLEMASLVKVNKYKNDRFFDYLLKAFYLFP